MSLVRLKHKMRRAIRPFMILFAVIFFVSCFTLYGSYTYSRTQQTAPVARVNGVDISDVEFRRSVDRIESMFGRQGGLETQWMAYKYGFDSVVDEYLRQQAAEKMGLAVQRQEAEDARDADIDAQLKQIGEGLTGTQLEEERSRLASMPENSVEARTRQLLSQRLDEKLKANARPVELRLSEIVIKKEKRTPDQAKTKAQEVYEKAKLPRADFAALARALSEDNATKNKGGDLDWVKPGSALDPELVAAAFQLKKGQVSQPIPITDGWAILKVTDERPYVSTKKDPKQQKEDVDSYKAQVAQSITTGFYAALKRQAKIEPLSPMIKGIVAEEEVGPGATLPDVSPQGKAKLQEAANAFEEARKKEPQPPSFIFHLGQIYSRLGEYDKAIAAYRDVLARVSSTEVHMALAKALEKKGDKAGAVAEYQEASKNAYDQPMIHGELTQTFKSLGRPDLAAQEDAKNQKYLKETRAEQARRQAEQKRMMDLQKQAAAAAKKKSPPAPASATTGATTGATAPPTTGSTNSGITLTPVPAAPGGAKQPATTAPGKGSAPVSASPK